MAVENIENINTKLKLGFLSPISGEWFHLHSDKIEMAKTIDEAKYILFESNGDPIPLIMKIKAKYPKNKLVFILSGDLSAQIDNECIWFTNAVKPSGLALKQTQIFVSNPAIFKFYEAMQIQSDSNIYASKGKFIMNREIEIYFKGTIWSGMRTDMYNYFKDKPKCKIIENNKYWDWRMNPFIKPTQKQLEENAFESYGEILQSKICLCPKGNGNSSMRIIEALACGSIPVLINDFSSPFGNAWEEFGFSFDTTIHSWEYIYAKCGELLNDETKIIALQKKGFEYFKNVIYGDARLPGFKIYNDLNTVCFGFSNLIVEKLLNMH
jgi:hypothetical protein